METKLFSPSIPLRIGYAITRGFIIFLILLFGTVALEEFLQIFITAELFPLAMLTLPWIAGIILAVIRPATVIITPNEIQVNSLIKKASYDLDEYFVTSESNSYGYYGAPLITFRKLVFNKIDNSGKTKKIRLRCIGRKKFSLIMNSLRKIDDEKNPHILKETATLTPEQASVVANMPNPVNIDISNVKAQKIPKLIFGILIVLPIILIIGGVLAEEYDLIMLSIGLVALFGFAFVVGKIRPKNMVNTASIGGHGVEITTKQGTYSFTWEDIQRVEMTPVGYNSTQVRTIIITVASGARHVFAFGVENNDSLDPYYIDAHDAFHAYGHGKLELIFR